MFSSPILSNANGNGMPISCFLTYVEDTVEGLIEHTEELRWMSVMGGGVGGHWDHVRSVSKKSPGPIPFLKTVDSDMVAYRQGQTRKGSYAAYLDVSHPDLIEFLNVRMPTGGDPARKCFNINNAVNLTDEFMTAVMSGSKWDLVDPADKTVRDTVDARELWQRILEVRFRTGEPYLNFIDEANRHLPQPLKDKGLKIHGSNLCNEIHLPTGVGRSAVCCLSSLNVEMFDEWKDTSIVEDLIEFLDDVLQFFIENAPAQLGKAVRSAQSERSLGLGTMGFHAYLQKKGLPFESVFAVSANRKIYSTIKERAVASSRRLAELKGEYLDGVGSGMRNSHLLAIAPNANSAIILDTSPSIEPWKSNAFTHRTRAGSFLQFNKYLRAVLESHQERLPEEDREEWIDDQVQSIILAQGSVQHLDYLTVSERDTFKTAFELDQMWVVEHAGVRQEWICQGQSVNLFFPAGSDKNYVNAVHLSAWKKQLKGLYYLRTSAGVVADKVSEKIERKALKDYDIDECISCQG
jgi:ribonucleoside-diphosphate reductase alpha chain